MFQTKFVKRITIFSNFSFENLVIFETMCENIAVLETPQMTTRRMRISRNVPKTTNTHS